MFLKVNEPGYADAFAAEADGLSALRAAGVRAPEPLAHGVAGGAGLPAAGVPGPRRPQRLRRAGPHAGRGASQARSALRLAARQLHRLDAADRTRWSDDWGEFWLERRLRPQLELAKRNGFSLSVPSSKLLDGHQPQPSLLHGDLWSGNVGFTPNGPVVFDPAVYYGDREADLAMTELFGGFPREFYAPTRKHSRSMRATRGESTLYNLYHLLNHLNLFGGGYLAQVEETLGLCWRSRASAASAARPTGTSRA